jgi:hypothetical protein
MPNSIFALALTLVALGAALPASAQFPRMAAGMSAAPYAPPMPAPAYLFYNGRYAYAPPGLPLTVARAVAAANELQGKPYVWGGGHIRLNDRGYDCSGAVSYALIGAGLLRAPLPSGPLMRFGEAGAGRWITVYAHGGHAFVVIAGRRFDTSGRGEEGPRWRTQRRSGDGYTVRHPPGL